MRLLLDTHVFLWTRTEPSKLRKPVRDEIADVANEVFVSSIAVWEITIKYMLGRLGTAAPAPSSLEARIRSAGFRELAFTAQHAAAIASLPALHSDPFDRAMVAQASVESLTLVTADQQILKYPIPLMRAR